MRPFFKWSASHKPRKMRRTVPSLPPQNHTPPGETHGHHSSRHRHALQAPHPHLHRLKSTLPAAQPDQARAGETATPANLAASPTAVTQPTAVAATAGAPAGVATPDTSRLTLAWATTSARCRPPTRPSQHRRTRPQTAGQRHPHAGQGTRLWRTLAERPRHSAADTANACQQAATDGVAIGEKR